ncbi:MAG: 5-formyltetrahydrofolate cyclo-ligase [Gammaproteobacteria bacterium]|jgi:5-formyltetrahydrofolate cyclo-ligase
MPKPGARAIVMETQERVFMSDDSAVRHNKSGLRAHMHALRANFASGSSPGANASASRSEAACQRLESLPAYVSARTVSWSISIGDELGTHDAIARAFASKQVAVPYCERDTLRLWVFAGFDELAPSTWGILEPPAALRKREARWLDPKLLNMVVVPGLAFDRTGARLGYGKGYYDGLLAQRSPHTICVGLCFAEQVVDVVPTQAHDIAMDFIVTDRELIAPKPAR